MSQRIIMVYRIAKAMGRVPNPAKAFRIARRFSAEELKRIHSRVSNGTV